MRTSLVLEAELKTCRPVDLLPGKQPTTLAQWLREHLVPQQRFVTGRCGRGAAIVRRGRAGCGLGARTLVGFSAGDRPPVGPVGVNGADDGSR